MAEWPDSRTDSLRFRLRNATQSLHSDVERYLDLNRATNSLPAYRTLLAKLLTIYAPFEQALLQIDWQDCGIAIEDRRKVRWLERDLAYLGVDTSGLEKRQDLPRLESIADGMGVLYVLEGSTLGGQVISRTLQAKLGLSAETGARFFSSYGERIGAMWRSYTAVLERLAGSEDDSSRIECAAMETFATFTRGLAISASEVDIYSSADTLRVSPRTANVQ